VGLRNTRQRLQHLYAGTHRFALRDGSGGGAEVEVEIPYRSIWTENEPPASNGGLT